MKNIFTCLLCLISGLSLCHAEATAENNPLVATIYDNSIPLGYSKAWEDDYASYLNTHEIYSIKLVSEPVYSHDAHYPLLRYQQKVKIISALRGDSKKEINIAYFLHKDSKPFAIDIERIVIGSWDMRSFSIIAHWHYTKNNVNLFNTFLNIK